VRLLYLWGPVLAHMALIFAASSRSETSAVPSAIPDKVMHFAVYALLGALTLRAVAGGRRAGVTWSGLLVSIVVATLYGITDEWHQSFVPGRTPEAMDVVADLAGASSGALAGIFAARISAPKREAVPRAQR
jgi:VanZ family protein